MALRDAGQHLRPFGHDKSHGLGRKNTKAKNEIAAAAAELEEKLAATARKVQSEKARRSALRQRFRAARDGGAAEQARLREEVAANGIVLKAETARVAELGRAAGRLASLYVELRSVGAAGGGPAAGVGEGGAGADDVLLRCGSDPVVVTELLRAAVSLHLEQQAAAMDESSARAETLGAETDALEGQIAALASDATALRARLRAAEAARDGADAASRAEERRAEARHEAEAERLAAEAASTLAAAATVARRAAACEASLAGWREEWLPLLPGLDADVAAARQYTRVTLHQQAVRHTKLRKDLGGDISSAERLASELEADRAELAQLEGAQRAAAEAQRDASARLAPTERAARSAEQRVQGLRAQLTAEHARARKLRCRGARDGGDASRAFSREAKLRQEDEEGRARDRAAAAAREEEGGDEEAAGAAQEAAEQRKEDEEDVDEDGLPRPPTMTAWRSRLRPREGETGVLRQRVRGLLRDGVQHAEQQRARQTNLATLRTQRAQLEKELARRCGDHAAMVDAHEDKTGTEKQQQQQQQQQQELEAEKELGSGSDSEACGAELGTPVPRVLSKRPLVGASSTKLPGAGAARLVTGTTVKQQQVARKRKQTQKQKHAW